MVRAVSEPSRWAARPVWARALRLVVFLAPVAGSTAAAWGVHRTLPPAGDLLARGWHLAVLIGVSTAALLLVDRLARRLLPLVTLLDLTLLFPEKAPSRLAVARDAIRRRPVEEQLQRVRDAGADPNAVAREILSLVAALSAHDRPTRGHAERVRMYTDLVADQLRVPARDRDLLRWAAILHDIGKLRVPPAILNKPGKPDEDEWAVLRAHPAHGAEIAGALLPWLGDWGDVIAQHHERWDGTGYPRGLAGRETSFGGRIVAVADAYDVMTAARAYKRPVSRGAACRELVRFSGSQFDPAVVRAMVSLSAPRLRRAQGVLAWLSDIPMVAAGSVPASTVARVVGAGALATGAVAGTLGVPPGPITSTPPAVAVGGTVSPGPAAAGAPADGRTSPATAEARPRPAELDRTPSGAPATTGPGRSADGTAGPEGSGPSTPSGPAGSGTPGDPTGSTGSGGSGGPADLGDTVGDVAGGLTGTVDDVAGGLTGTVGGVTGTGALTGTVGDTVDGATDTVDSTVDGASDVVDGVVGGVVGGLLGR